MVTENETQNKLRDVVNLLPKKNCGKCGYENCPEFAKAVINKEASPFGCRQDSSAGYQISKILGFAVPEVSTAKTGSEAGNRVGTAQGKHQGEHHNGAHGGHSGHSGLHGHSRQLGRHGHN